MVVAVFEVVVVIVVVTAVATVGWWVAGCWTEQYLGWQDFYVVWQAEWSQVGVDGIC